MNTINSIIEALSKTTYKKPQTVLDIINNRTILLEVVDELINSKEKENND